MMSLRGGCSLLLPSGGSRRGWMGVVRLVFTPHYFFYWLWLGVVMGVANDIFFCE